MSLRIFHIVFISVCIVFSLFMAWWGIRSYAAGEGTQGIVLAAIFIVTGVGLVVYGIRVYGKLKELE